MLDWDTCLQCSIIVDETTEEFREDDEADGSVWPSDESTESFDEWQHLGWRNPDIALLELPEGSDDEDDQETPTLP